MANRLSLSCGVVSVVLLCLLPVSLAKAFSSLPEIMSGATSLTTDSGQTVYANMVGNYAILNQNSLGLLGFNTSVLKDGCLFSKCFTLGTGADGLTALPNNQNDMLLTSKTYIDGGITPVYELPALLFVGLNVQGDVYAGSDLGYLLKFWNPASLFQGDGTAEGAGWTTGQKYVFNPDAQVAYGSDKFAQYTAQLNSLAGSGKPTTAAAISANPALYLQGDTLGDSGNSEVSLYPEGKVWFVSGNLTLNSVQTFSGVGTIVIKNGNFTLGAGANLQPANSNSRLGIMVLNDSTHPTVGKCIINNSTQAKVTAMMYCMNQFSVAKSGEFRGSFVASGFSISNTQSVLFAYDPAFDNNQPPGFRGLIMPHPQEVGNN